MRCGVWRNITLVHGVAAIKEHRIRHLGAIEMRPRWPAIFADVDVRSHDVAPVIDVVSEYARDVVWIFGYDVIVARRGGEAGFASGNSRFADQSFAFVKVSFLFTKVDHDFGRAGYVITMPIAGRLWCKHGEGMFDIRWNFFAAGAQKDDCYPSQGLS